MRSILVALMLASGCEHGESPAADGGTDGAVDARPTGSFNARIGEACDETETPFCNGGSARCYHNTCRAFCSATSHPACAAGFVEERTVDPDTSSRLCVCLPL